MVRRVKESGADIVMCSGLRRRGEPPAAAGRPQGRALGAGGDIELLAMATGARIVPRFEELTAAKLGTASVEQRAFGTTDNDMIVVKELSKSKAVS